MTVFCGLVQGGEPVAVPAYRARAVDRGAGRGRELLLLSTEAGGSPGALPLVTSPVTRYGHCETGVPPHD